jgi:hypothetical protein
VALLTDAGINGYLEIVSLVRSLSHGETHQVICHEKRSLSRGVSGKMQKHGTTCNWGKAEKCQNRRFHLQGRCCPSAAHRCDQLNSAKRHVEKDCLELVKAKVLHNQRTESGHSAAWDGDGKHHGGPKPRLEIQGSLSDMSPFPLSAFDALIVCSQPGIISLGFL